MTAMGKISFWALLVYVVFRLGDLAIRQQLAGAFSGKTGALFAAELILGGLLPLALLAATFRHFRPSAVPPERLFVLWV